MNLDILNSGVPDQKKYLNIVCNSLTANFVNIPVEPTSEQVFAISMLYGLIIPVQNITVTNVCTENVIVNPNINLSNNTYTASRDEYLFITLQYVLNCIAGGGQSDINILVNGVPLSIKSREQINSGGNSEWSCTCNGIIKLNAGDVLSYEFTNQFFGVGFGYRDFYFSGTRV
ncbi:MAG: hypothetical protein Q8910_02775 [Bacteroidota bacterium]|nr:hypothetical protein [Bacteroidota bacterium]